MMLFLASDPVGLSGDYLLITSRLLEVQRIQDQLDILQALQPPADCIPDWKGDAKNAFVIKLGEMTTSLTTVRAEISSAVSDLRVVIAELADV